MNIEDYIRYWAQLINESEEDKLLNEMAVRKVDEIISNPKILERNWDEVLDILFENDMIYKFDFKSFLNSSNIMHGYDIEQPTRGDFSLEWTLFGDGVVDGEGRFEKWLEKNKGFEYSEELKHFSYGYTNGDLEITVKFEDGYDGPFVEYENNDKDKFKNLVKEYMIDMGYQNAKYIIGSIPLSGSTSEMAKQLAEMMNNKESKMYKVLSQYLFSDREDEFGDYNDETLSQADEVYQEQYMSSVAAGGGDPSGDAEYAREEFLKKARARR